MTFWPRFLLIHVLLGTAHALSTYRYFAIGSNMLPSTMESLRNIRDYEATAGLLLNYELAFDIEGSPGLEPSAASARKSKGAMLHGVLYALSERDFARVGSTEGVPFAYRWEKCYVYPYVGDGEKAGVEALDCTEPVEAYVLVNPTPKGNDTPPSPSYLRILKRGAEYWKLDRDYQRYLGEIPCASRLILADGLAGKLLEVSTFFNPPKTKF